MKYLCVVAMTLVAPVACAMAPATAAKAATCAVPVDRLLRSLELELPGDTRVMRSVEIPADTEILVEAFETNINSRLEVREPSGELATADSPLRRWAPQRVVVPGGPARQLEVSVVGLERARGRVDVRLSRVSSQDDSRCVDFWRAMASGDAAFSRGEIISTGALDAAQGEGAQAYESAVAAYARAVPLAGARGFDEAQARLVYATALLFGINAYEKSAQASLAAATQFEALGQEYGRDRARFFWVWAMLRVGTRTTDETEARRIFESARSTGLEVAASHLARVERYEQGYARSTHAMMGGSRASRCPTPR